MSIKELVNATAQEKRNSLRRILLTLCLTLIVIFVFGRHLSKRIREMILASKEMVSGNFQQVLKISGQDELTVLSEQFNQMAFEINKRILEITDLNQSLELRVAKRTGDLAKANQQLEQHLAHLKAAQDKLIQAEKMASLGSLVAGVAHELNTPIGNAVTVVSALVDKQGEIQAMMQSGTVKKTALEAYVNMVEEASRLLETNIVRAANLISSFKTIAVNQSNEARSKFKLKAFLQSLVPTLRLQARHKKIDFQIDVADDIELNSYPGSLTQIIINLYVNAIAHAFEKLDEGCICISAEYEQAQPSNILIRFADNGAGIPTEHLTKIFDPFFTTKLGHGGSGLGLHICYNIANNILGGNIKVNSTDGKGTEFLIWIARVAPAEVAHQDI